MNVSHIISELSPLNSNEKVDALILKMSENNVIMTVHAKFAIRDAIKDDNVLEYFYEKYDGRVSETDIEKERKRQRRAVKERKKIAEERETHIKIKKKYEEPFCFRTKEDIDLLFEDISYDNIIIDKKLDTSIRLGIKKVKLQLYYDKQ